MDPFGTAAAALCTTPAPPALMGWSVPGGQLWLLPAKQSTGVVSGRLVNSFYWQDESLEAYISPRQTGEERQSSQLATSILYSTSIL